MRTPALWMEKILNKDKPIPKSPRGEQKQKKNEIQKALEKMRERAKKSRDKK